MQQTTHRVVKKNKTEIGSASVCQKQIPSFAWNASQVYLFFNLYAVLIIYIAYVANGVFLVFL